jgi:hypothetical protein
LRVVKLYRKPDKPEFFVLVRSVANEILLVYPIELPERKRQARWLSLDEVYIDWIREFT